MDASAFDDTAFAAEESDPMSSVANLVDVMLVFACGLMMALVAYWNVDISSVTDVQVNQEMSEVSNIDQMKDEMQSGGAGYTELGKVYQDPATGKMYMITEDAVTGASSQTEVASTTGGSSEGTAASGIASTGTAATGTTTTGTTGTAATGDRSAGAD